MAKATPSCLVDPPDLGGATGPDAVGGYFRVKGNRALKGRDFAARIPFVRMTSSPTHIHIKGARTHNLKNLELRLPRNAFTVICGVSGSGKSSLAFDTLYAEGYRKYIESLSTRARQVLEQMPRPEVDFIHGLGPVIAVEQDAGAGHNPRSTVGTVTEVADYARLLWSLAAEARCPEDGGAIVRRSLDDWVESLLGQYAARAPRAVLLAPWMEAKPSVLRGEIPSLRQRGWERVRVGGEILRLDDFEEELKGREAVAVELVVDRLVLRADQRSRLADSLELAFREGEKRALLLVEEAAAPGGWAEVPLSQDLSCEVCGRLYAPLTVKSFSWNHPHGACPTCGGVGLTLQFAPELVVPDPSLPVKKGALKPWRLGSKRMIIERNAQLRQLAEQLPYEAETPWEELPAEVRDTLLHGAGERLFAFKLRPGNRKPELMPFPGVLADLERTRRETSSEGLRARLMAYQVSQECRDCEGRRLRPESRAALLDGLAFDTFMDLPLSGAWAWMLDFRERHREAGRLRVRGQLEEVVDGLESRLRFLCEVGLGYLSLGRGYHTLSGGEGQRVRLATQLGMGLVGVTYVLDEPTIGLHPADARRLLGTLLGMRDRGNTVVVVEHEDIVVRAADHLVEIGPGAGEHGGHITFEGLPAEAEADPRCLTGAFLSGRQGLEKTARTRVPGTDRLTVRGATAHNLKGIDVSFPVGLLTCVAGVSGSGKSTLVNDVLGRAAAFKLNRAKEIPGPHQRIEGLEHFERVIRVDQEPIGRSPRSNPATFTKLFDELRKLFAQCPLAKVRGYGPSRFSFNVRGGRCERCQGDGQIRLDMQFLADVYTECPSCHGARYNRETLEVRYRGLNIAEVLDLSVDEALRVFARHPKIQPRLETLHSVGLGYLRLGQAANTLSGGEAQRLKLSLELGKRLTGRTLYILDEPTTGLHWVDVQKLMDLLFKLRDAGVEGASGGGNTIIVIEHHLDVLRLADWVVDLGPGGGVEGGELLFAGPPERLRAEGASLTAAALRGEV
jgi:excinuclease ABC subunit A